MKFGQTGRIMRTWILSLSLWVSLSLSLFLSWSIPAVAQQPAPPPRAPKLVVAIVIDQFRYDYLTRFRSEYTGGLKRLLTEGADFTNSRYRHYPTVTAVGHSTFLSGATPSTSGIIGNEWWDRTTGAVVTSVSDPQTRLVGGSGTGSSPWRLLQSTIGRRTEGVRQRRQGNRDFHQGPRGDSALRPLRRRGVLVR